MPSLLLVACDGKITNAFLQENRFQVSTAQSTVEALAKVHGTKYDFILFSSPPNNDVMQNVRAAKPNLRARILVAGITDEGVHQRGWAGVVALGPATSAEALARAVAQLQNTKGVAVELDSDFAEAVVNSIGKSLIHRFRIRNVLPEDSGYVGTHDTPLTDFSALIALACAPYEGIVAISFPAATLAVLARTSADGTRTVNLAEGFNRVAWDLAQSLRAHGYPEREPHAVNLIDSPQMRAAPLNCARALLWVLDCDAGKFYVQFFLAS